MLIHVHHENAISWLNFVKCRPGDYGVLIERLSLYDICVFRSQIRYLSLGIGMTTDFIFKFSNGIMFFDFFWVFDEQFLKVPFHLQFL